MRLRAFALLLIAFSTAAFGVGCDSKASSGTTDLTSPSSSAPGTQVKQPLGASSAGTKPAPSR